MGTPHIGDKLEFQEIYRYTNNKRETIFEYGRVLVMKSKRIVEERRFKLIRFDSPDIKNFFIVDDENGYPLHIKNNDLPDDHILISFSFIGEGKAIICLIASETFDRIRDDDAIDMIMGRNKYNVRFIQMGQFKIRQ